MSGGETCARPDLLRSAGDRIDGIGDEVADDTRVDGGSVDVLDGLLVPDLVDAARFVTDQVGRSGDALAAGLGVVRTDLRAWAQGFEVADS